MEEKDGKECDNDRLQANNTMMMRMMRHLVVRGKDWPLTEQEKALN